MGNDENEIRDKKIERNMRGEGGSDYWRRGGKRRVRGCSSREVVHLTDGDDTGL